MNLLEVKNLKVHFPVKHGLFSRVMAHVKPVDDASFAMKLLLSALPFSASKYQRTCWIPQLLAP